MVSLTPSSTAGKATMSGAARPKTLYEKLESLPDELMAEIIDGQLHTQPRPGPTHAVAASNLGAELIGPYSRAKGGPGGWWIIFEPELHFRRDAEVLVPDLAAWKRERMPELPPDQRFEVRPDWICEVLSPSTRSKDREIKMPLYARYGVPYVWLVDPKVRTLETYHLRGTELVRTATFGAETSPAAAPFEAAVFRVGDLWT
jgi:Uma2 family endonuclease